MGADKGKDLIGYNVLVENGLRSVVRGALRRVAEEGWPGTHHAYITFRTAAPGVEVPDFLQTRYPGRADDRASTPVLGVGGGGRLLRRDAELQQGRPPHRRALRGAHQLRRPVGQVRPAVRAGAEASRKGRREAASGSSRQWSPKRTCPRRTARRSCRTHAEMSRRTRTWRVRRRRAGKSRQRWAETSRRRRAETKWSRSTGSARSSYSSHSRLPQTPISCPVILRADSCARKNAASATSSQAISERVEMKLT